MAKSFIKWQLFGETPIAEEPATETVDYQAKIDELTSQNARYKASIDKLSSENANYKRLERENMTKEQQAQADSQALNEELAELRKAVARSEAEKIFAKKGISESIYGTVLDSYSSTLNREQVSTLSNLIATAIEKSVKEAVELNNNKTLQTGTVLPNGKNQSKTQADFARELAKSQKTTEIDKIKNSYK